MEIKAWQNAACAAVLIVLGFTLNLYREGYLSILIFSFVINGVMAVSYDIPGRSLGLISLGHAVFFGLGAYIFGIAVSKGLAFLPSLFITAAAGFVCAAVIVMPLARLNHGYFSLATLGVLFIFQRLAESLESITGGPAGLFVSETVTPVYCGHAGLILLILTTIGYVFFSSSRWGMYSRETEADEEAAEAIGIPTYRVKLVGLTAAALPAALAGALHLARTSHISPVSGFSLTLSITALLASRIVPARGPLGPLLGALLITALEEVIWTKFSGFNQALFGLILLAAALYQGIVKSRNTLQLLK